MKTVKNRKRKFALGIKIAALCSCLALASVGFASWLVVQDPDAKHNVGDVNVALTAEADLLFEEPAAIKVSDTNLNLNSFSFGRPATEEVEIKWLVPQEVATEDMIEEYTLKFKPQNLPKGTVAHVSLDFDAVYKTISGDTTNYADRNTELATLISKGYLTLTITVGEVGSAQSVTYDKDNALPVTGGVVNYDVDWDTLDAAQKALDVGAQSISLPLTIQFGWGDAFKLTRTIDEEEVTKNWNPYIYYNSLSNPTAEQKIAALEVLAEIAATIKGLDYEQVKAGTANEVNAKPISYLVVIDAELDLSAVTY